VETIQPKISSFDTPKKTKSSKVPLEFEIDQEARSSSFKIDLDFKHDLIHHKSSEKKMIGQSPTKLLHRLSFTKELSKLEEKKSLMLNERIIKQVTVQGYFDDPMLPYRMREVIVLNQNKQLLRHYETSLPSWAVVMATYGYYRPSFRKFQYWFMMVISLISMMIGFFDLYKNLPIIKPLLITYMESIWNWLEDHVIFRMTFFMGYLFSQSSLTANVAIFLMKLPLLNHLWLI